MLNLDLASRRYHTDANLERLFRFDLEKLHELEDNLGIPEVVMVGKSDGTTFKLDGTPKRPWGGKSVTNTEILLIMLFRLHRPHTHGDVALHFGLSEQVAELTFNWGVRFLAHTYAPGLQDIKRWWKYLPSWADAVRDKAHGVDMRVFAFVDVVCRKICRPTSQVVQGVVVDVQRYYFSGCAGTHVLKYQGLTAPCGLLIGMFGPCAGAHSDAWCWHESQVQQQIYELQLHWLQAFAVYGDPGYFVCPQLFMPFIGVVTAAQRAYNYIMARVRVAVEWSFGDVVNQFAFCNYQVGQKVHSNPVMAYQMAAALLTNCIVCAYPSRTEKYFNCGPPTIEEYLYLLRLPVGPVASYVY